ncbi:MAG TPA: hypothetical protein VNB22_01900 [Pyrinomonadaceae bacterium]|nr:hypothetical protein [Pyrinomonadaceae bacterium]
MSEQFAAVRALAVTYAFQELGKNVREIGQQDRGTRIDVYERAAGVGLREGMPGRQWCGMFIYWCYRQAANHFNVALPFTGDDLWSGEKVVRWSRRHQDDVVVELPVQAGDIYVLWSYHIGMAVDQSINAGTFRSIDGNQSSANTGHNSLTTNEQRAISNCRLIVRI